MTEAILVKHLLVCDNLNEAGLQNKPCEIQ